MKKLFTAVLLLTGFMSTLAAQELKTSYFLDNYVYSYRINPAAQFESEPFSFVAVGLGNTSVSAASNMGLDAFVYKTSDAYTWGFAEAVPRKTFLSRLNEDNYLMPQFGINLFTFGRQGEDYRYAVELNVKSDTYVYAPKQFFAAFKDGIDIGLKEKKGSYSISDFLLNSDNYTEIAFCYSRKLRDDLIVGGAAKALIGLAKAQFNISSMNVHEMSGDWGGSCNGDVLVATKLMDVSQAMKGGNSVYDILQDAALNGVGIAGFGFSFDVGVTWTPIENLEVGLSALDLGFINWKNAFSGKIDYENKIFNEVEDAVEFKSVDTVSSLKGLNYNVHLFAKYRTPFYDKLSFGMLGSFQPYFKELRLGADVTPIKAVSLAASAAYNSFGFDVGAALNFRFPGINLFLGADSLVFGSTDGIPSGHGLTNVTAGLVFAF